MHFIAHYLVVVVGELEYSFHGSLKNLLLTDFTTLDMLRVPGNTMNSDEEVVLVTGASGNVGREVVKALRDSNFRARAALRTLDERGDGPGAFDEVVHFDFGDSSTFPAAFDAVTSLFLLRPPPLSDVDRFIRPVIDYAAAMGVRRIVFLSLQGAGRNLLIPHTRIENIIESSGLPYTFLRSGFFMQNLDTTHREDIVAYDDLFIPAGAGRTAFIDTRDVGEIAARMLTEPGHEGQAYTLTGCEALTYDEVADVMAEILGRPITYSNPSLLTFARRMRGRGHAWGYIGVMIGIYLTTRRGLSEEVSSTAAELLGHPPRTVRQYVADYAAAWQKPDTTGSSA